MKPGTAILKSSFIGVFRAFPESRMDIRVVDIVRVFPKTLHEGRERPYGQFPRIDGLGYLANVPHNLSIPDEIVNKLSVGRAECAFDQRTESGFGRRPGLLGAFVARQQRLEICAAE